MSMGPEPGMMSTPAGMDSDPGTDDKMESTVAASVAMATARQAELQSDAIGAGSTIGDVMDLPDVPSDYGKFSGGENGPLPSTDNQNT